MLYIIAHALNQPYGFDAQDIKLNRVCAQYSHDCLIDFATAKMDLADLIVSKHDTPYWLERPITKRDSKAAPKGTKMAFIPDRLRRLMPKFQFRAPPARTFIAFGFFVAWCCIIVFATWIPTRHEERKINVRWWDAFVPIGTSTVGYLSLALFLLLGFWIGDAYARYWRGLQMWQSRLTTNLSEVAFQIAMCCKRGLWNDPRDRERIFSHLAALPFAAKIALRESKDVSELAGILAPTDLAALESATDAEQYVLNVLYAYISSADARHPGTFSGEESPFTASVYKILDTLWELEKAISECKGMRKFPISPAFTTHLKVFLTFWLILLPWITLLYSGFFSFVYVLPFGYAIINLMAIGRGMSDPFGFDDDDIPLDVLCSEMVESIHRIYGETLEGPQRFIAVSNYRRQSFLPKPVASNEGQQHIGVGIDDMDSVAIGPTNVDVEAQPESESSASHSGQDQVVVNEGALNAETAPQNDKNDDNKSDDLEELKMALQQLKVVPLKIFAFFRKTFNVIRFLLRIIIKLLGFHRCRLSWKRREDQNRKNGKVESLRAFLRGIILLFPKVSPVSLIAAVVWTLIAVFVSFGMSYLWGDDRQDSCAGWCSPIDIESAVIEYTAFALFLLVAFHSSSAVERYEEGARLIFNLEMNLRNTAVEIVQVLPEGFFHAGDKERIVAHLTQIPLCLRDMLLHDGQPVSTNEGLLSEDDCTRLVESASPIDHLLHTVEAYFLAQDGSHRKEITVSSKKLPRAVTDTVLRRLSTIRSAIAWILSVKRFPVVKSYSAHQHFFTHLWLFFLPLSMTPDSGFFTILWAPLICYVVLCLDSLAKKLIDPFGNDDIDLPVHELCVSATNAILDAVHSVEWGSNVLCRASPREVSPSIGCVISGRTVKDEYTLAHLQNSFNRMSTGMDTTEDEIKLLKFSGPRESKVLPSLFGYFTRSTRWWVFLLATAWIAVSTMVSYLIRQPPTNDERWWQSVIYNGENIVSALSFVTFVILGLYLNDAFYRYNAAANVWLEGLKTSCHTLATQFLLLTPRDSIHPGDHDRIIGHIAAIPLLLKRELRGSRDVREVKGLVSLVDLARMECVPSPSELCLDVVRSYVYNIQCNPEVVSGAWVKPRRRAEFIMQEIRTLEQIIRDSKFVTTFRIAPGFMSVLKAFLILWFVMTPFTIAEYTGWFTILYLPIMAYGLLGMYSLGKELQNPYGHDLNDLDLDELADEIVGDILELELENRGKWVTHVRPVAPAESWLTMPEGSMAEMFKPLFVREDLRNPIRLIRSTLRVGKEAIPRWLISSVVIWTFICVLVSFLVGRFFDFPVRDRSCHPWFCSAIALSPSAIEYVSYALFLLLGLRLYHSQYRYVDALSIWEDGLIGTARLFTNQLFQSFKDGTWHEGDLVRICGHIAAYPICVMGALRHRDYREKLLGVLGEDDVQRILVVTDRPAFCIDVVRSYLIDGERLESEHAQTYLCSANEHWKLLWYLRKLSGSGRECMRLAWVPVPYGYQIHLRVFLGLWLLVLPFALVEVSGWLTIIWMPFVAYAVIGMEAWAERLSNPYGQEDSIVPLEALSERVVLAIKSNMRALQAGAASLIREDRNGFPGNVEDRIRVPMGAEV